MKHIQAILFIFFLFKADAQNSLWKKIKINNVVSCMMPHKTDFSKNGNICAWFGEKNKSVYQVDYIDSIVLIPNSNSFKLSLEGFVSGLVIRPPFPKYDVTVNDTLMGRTIGVFVKFSAGDRGLKYKTVFYYITMADHKYIGSYI